MWKTIIKILEKYACNHQWETLCEKTYDRQNEGLGFTFTQQTRFLLKCTKCGRIRKIKV